jgi:tRNA(Ile)-lysidine synthase
VLAAEAGAIADSFSPAELKVLFNGLAGTPGVAIAVSGGSDSMALLHLVLEWRGLMTEGPKLVVLTVDHGLRAESAVEARTVAAHCVRLDLEHHTFRWEGVRPTTAIQAKARAARYDLMTEWCHKNSVGVLLTAHTADDQAETVLMRSGRTESAESLAGIWPERQWQGIRVLRPLLSIRRSELRRYLAAKGVRWIEDPSNENERFERVRARRQLAGRDVADLVKTAVLAQEKVRAQSEMIDAIVARDVTIGQWGELRFPREAVFQLDSEELVCWCRRLVGALRGQVIAERAEFLRLAEWLADAGRGRRTLNGLIFQRLRSEIVVGREPGRIAASWQTIPAQGQMIWDGRFAITAPAGSKVGPALLAPVIPRNPEGPFWLLQGLPVVELPTGQRVLAFGTTDRKALEQLGIAASRTYVNALEGFPVA